MLCTFLYLLIDFEPRLVPNSDKPCSHINRHETQLIVYGALPEVSSWLFKSVSEIDFLWRDDLPPWSLFSGTFLVS